MSPCKDGKWEQTGSGVSTGLPAWGDRKGDKMGHGTRDAHPAPKIPLGVPRCCYHRDFLPKDEVDRLARVQGCAPMWSSTHRAEGCRRLSGRTIPVLQWHWQGSGQCCPAGMIQVGIY